MGGEWGLGSSLAMESIPPSARGMVSGILQCGYPTGYLLAAVVYGVLYQQTIGGYTIGWRAMFLLSFLPALIVLFIRSHVPESPAFVEAQKSVKPGLLETLQKHWGVALYAVVLMMFFNFFSHGTQDLYPTFLKKQHGFDPHTVSWITIVANIGAIVGGLAFGALSEKIGRVNAITLACLIALPSIPLWASAPRLSCSPLAPSSCRSRSRAPGASSRCTSTSFRPGPCVRPCPASSIKRAISPPPMAAPIRQESLKVQAAATATHWRFLQVWSPSVSSSSSASVRSDAAR